MRWLGLSALGVVVLLVLTACASAAQPAKPAAEPAKPAAQPAKPAAEPAKPAAQPAKPATQPSEGKKVIELRAGSSQPRPDIVTNPIDFLAKRVEEKTGGEVKIHVFPQSLGVEQQLMQLVMSGSVDFGTISNGNAGRFTDAWFVYDLPFLFKNTEGVLKSLKTPAGQRVIEKFERDLGVKLLIPMTFAVGRDIQTRSRPLRVPADIKGLKIRVVSTPVDLATFKAWGANPTPVDWAQTYTALQQGVVEGFQVPVTILEAGKWYEVVKHNMRIDYQVLIETFSISQKTLNSLKPEHQKAILEAGEEAQAFNVKDAQKTLDETMDRLTKRHGMTIYTPTPAEYTQWASVRETVWQEVAEQLKGKIDLDMAKRLYESQ